MAPTSNAGIRVLALRELLGLTQSELAGQTGVAQSLISQIEKGGRDLTSEVRIKIAAATRTPLSFFDAPASAIESDAVNFRKLSGASAKSTKSALRRYSEAERVSVVLLESQGHPIPTLTAPTSVGLTGADIEGIADATRRQMSQSQREPVRHVMRAMERAGIAVVPLSRLDEETDALDGHSGMSRHDPNSGHCVVGYVPCSAGDRQRLTLAHELGHLVLHAHRAVPIRAREQEAMRFAGAFLYPESVARADISESLNLNGYARIKAAWGISIQALVRRGFDLGLTSDDRYKSLMMQLSARGWRRSEPVEVGVEKPALMWSMLTAEYGPSPYARASHSLGVSPSHLEMWIPPRPNGHSQPSKEAQVHSLFA